MLIKNWKSYFITFLGGTLISGCHSGGSISAAPSLSISPSTLIPTIATPNKSPYYSKDSQINITGMCNNNDIVRLSGDYTGQTTCLNSVYSFTVNKNLDGIYSFVVDQVDPAQGVSPSVSTVWVRKTSIPLPNITLPLTNPFLSAEPTMNLQGACDSGATVTLSLINLSTTVDQTTCANSQFTFLLTKIIDGDYTYQITQTDLAGNSSKVNMIWKKHNIIISPPSTTLVVGNPQPLTITGGSEFYTINISQNNSGASFDSNSKTYTAGTLANKTDTVTVTDSNGSTAQVSFSTKSDVADHLVLIQGGSQNSYFGTLFAIPPKVKVVDKFNNGVAQFSLYFENLLGDLLFPSNAIQVTDALGFVSLSLQMGFTSIFNSVFVHPLNGSLPDFANTNNRTITFYENGVAKSNGNGIIGPFFKLATNPGAMVMANFGTQHHDNTHKDFAVLNTVGTSITVYYNQLNGIFNNLQYTTCAGPNSIVAADFNGDGIMDLAVACNSGFVSVLMGNKNNTFDAPQSFTTLPGPNAIAVGDFRHNGKIDIVVSSSVNGSLGIHFGNGNGSFQAASTITNATGLTPIGIITDDFNKDGATDIVVLNGTGANKISFLKNKNDGTGNFFANVDLATGLDPNSIAIGDFNNDGWDDVIVTNSTDNNVGIFLFDAPNNTFLTQDTTLVGANPNFVIGADLQLSGKNKDIIVINSGDGNIGFLMNQTANGIMSFGAMTLMQPPTLPSFLLYGNINGDPFPDLVATLNSGSPSIEIMQGHGTDQFGPFTSVGANPSSAAIGKLFTDDAKMYSVVTNKNSNTISILRQSGAGPFTVFNTLATSNQPVAVAIADLKNDGVQKIVVLNQGSNSVSIYSGSGLTADTFSKTDYPVGINPSAIAVKDINHDGKKDIIVANKNNHTVSVLLANADGTYQPKVDYQVGNGPVNVSLADLNQDNNLDIVVTNTTDGTVSILLGNGDGTFQNQILLTVGANPNCLALMDLNGDSIPDLIVGNSGDSTVNVFKGVGNGSFTNKATYTITGTILTGFALGDFFGNGKLDLAISLGDATFTILKGRGDGSFDPSALTYTSDNSSAVFNGVVASDLNGDNSIDLILLDANNNRIETWFGQ